MHHIQNCLIIINNNINNSGPFYSVEDQQKCSCIHKTKINI